MAEDGHRDRDDHAAPPATGGAGDDVDIVETGSGWIYDGEGYPPEAGLEPPDPGRLPEQAGMAEDPPDPPQAAPIAPASPTPPASADTGGVPAWHEFGTHLEELRRRLFLCLFVFVPLFGLGLWLYQHLWRVVILPLDRAAPHLLRFQALNPSDGLVMAMRIAFAFALFLSLPLWLSQAWCFVSPGLTWRERRWLYLGLGSGGVLFACGAVLAYFVAIPFALEYLLPFNQSLEGWENSFTGTGYVDFVITCCAGFGIAFELPLAMLVLGWAGILTPEAIREWWRPVILVVFVTAAILTPPDPFTQMLLAVPLLLLFILGYWLVKWTSRG